MCEKMEESFKTIIWYDDQCEWLEELADQIENTQDLFECPFEYSEWHKERHFIYMLLVGMFGNWGTSIRSGWIEQKEECVRYIRKICNEIKETEGSGDAE